LEKFFADVFKKTSHLHSFLKVLVLFNHYKYFITWTSQ